jgi:hypothetical protein
MIVVCGTAVSATVVATTPAGSPDVLKSTATFLLSIRFGYCLVACTTRELTALLSDV